MCVEQLVEHIEWMRESESSGRISLGLGDVIDCQLSFTRQRTNVHIMCLLTHQRSMHLLLIP